MVTVTPRRRWLPAAVFAFGAALGSGCRGGPANAPVDAALARETLKEALDSWKRGDKIDALRNASPPIFVIDQEWQDGAVLKDYRVAGDGEEKDANLYCSVVVTVRPRGGAEVRRTVTYVVGTTPHRTVTRKVF